MTHRVVGSKHALTEEVFVEAIAWPAASASSSADEKIERKRRQPDSEFGGRSLLRHGDSPSAGSRRDVRHILRVDSASRRENTYSKIWLPKPLWRLLKTHSGCIVRCPDGGWVPPRDMRGPRCADRRGNGAAADDTAAADDPPQMRIAS